jgi:hypothetical protein
MHLNIIIHFVPILDSIVSSQRNLMVVAIIDIKINKKFYYFLLKWFLFWVCTNGWWENGIVSLLFVLLSITNIDLI